MGRCNISVRCWFYRRDIDPTSPDFELLKKYCHGEYLACARYQFAESLGIRYLPRWLEPSDNRTIKGVTRARIS